MNTPVPTELCDLELPLQVAWWEPYLFWVSIVLLLVVAWLGWQHYQNPRLRALKRLHQLGDNPQRVGELAAILRSVGQEPCAELDQARFAAQTCSPRLFCRLKHQVQLRLEQGQ